MIALDCPRGSGETVVLVHGLGSHPLLMYPLERRLKRSGFETLNWGYPSLWNGIERHALRLAGELARLDAAPEVTRIHLVTHSMGGIVARRALLDARFTKLRSLVMLGPPNGGSRVASVLARGLGWLCQPLHELADGQDSFVNRLPIPEGIAIGVLAAQYDRVVAVEKTRLPSQRDHRVLPTGHNSMLFRRDVGAYVACFLREGQFAPQRA